MPKEPKDNFNRDHIKRNGETVVAEWGDRGTKCIATAKQLHDRIELRKYTADGEWQGHQLYAEIINVDGHLIAMNPLKSMPFMVEKVDNEKRMVDRLIEKMRGYKL